MQDLNTLFTPEDLKRVINPDGKSPDPRQPLLSKYHLAADCLAEACTIASTLPQSLKQLNPHVGDTCCEIRAHKFASMDLQLLDDLQKLQIEAQAISTKISALKAKLASAPISTKKCTFLDLLKTHSIEPTQISRDLKFLQHAILLTRAKKMPFDFSNDTFTLSSLGGAEITTDQAEQYGISTTQFKETIIKKIRKIMTQDSVDYARQELAHLQPTNFLSKVLVAQLQKAIGPDGLCANTTSERTVVAYFPLNVTLYSRAAEKGVPLLLKILRFSPQEPHFYRTSQLYVSQAGKFVPTGSQKDPTGTAAIILEGLSFDGTLDEFEEFVETHKEISCVHSLQDDEEAFKKRLLSYDILALLCADAAMHPQFAHKKETNIQMSNCIFDNQETLPDLANFMREAQKIALSIGVCKENMRLFYLRHIYADVL